MSRDLLEIVSEFLNSEKPKCEMAASKYFGAAFQDFFSLHQAIGDASVGKFANVVNIPSLSFKHWT